MSYVAPVFNQAEGHKEIVLAENQPQYEPLPVGVVLGRRDKPVTVRYRPTAEELQKLMEGADICLTQLTFGRGYAPINFQIVPRDEDPIPTEVVA
jgi:hypothetical protein